jgi:hypothetical protein
MVPVVGASTTALAIAALGLPAITVDVRASIAALRALFTLIEPVVLLQGYATVADQGGGIFLYIPTDTTSADDGGTIIVDAAGRRWYRELGGESLTPEMFGAVGNGTTDDTTALTAFFAAMQTTPMPLRQPGSLSARTYSVSGGFSITKPITLRGVNNQLSVISNSNAALNVPILHLSGTAVNGSILEDFGILSVAGTPSGCIGVQVDGGQRFSLTRLQVSYTNSGISVPAATTGASINECFVNNTTAYGYNVDAGNMNLRGCYAINCAGNGYQFTSLTAASAGLVLAECTAFNCGTGGSGGNFIFLGNATHPIIDLQVTGCTSSASPNGAGFDFDTHGVNITLDNLYAELAGMSGAGAYVSQQVGVFVSANNANVTMSAITVSTCGGSGIDMECGYWTLNGATLTANNQGANANGSGLIIGVGGAVHNFSATGLMTAVATTPIGVPDAQKYGVNSFTSGSTGLVVNSILHGVVAALNNAGTTVTFANNLNV